MAIITAGVAAMGTTTVGVTGTGTTVGGGVTDTIIAGITATIIAGITGTIIITATGGNPSEQGRQVGGSFFATISEHRFRYGSRRDELWSDQSRRVGTDR